jgi:hypothetical protein
MTVLDADPFVELRRRLLRVDDGQVQRLSAASR